MPYPNIEYHVQPLSLDAFGEPLHGFDAFTASVCNLNPPAAARCASARQLRGCAADRAQLPEHAGRPQGGRRFAARDAPHRRAAGAGRYQPQEWKPGTQYESDEDLARLAGDIATTIFHPVGPPRWGATTIRWLWSTPSCGVRGIAGLRVVDAGVMPTITSGNTNSPTLMLAEKAAEWIVARLRRRGQLFADRSRPHGETPDALRRCARYSAPTRNRPSKASKGEGPRRLPRKTEIQAETGHASWRCHLKDAAIRRLLFLWRAATIIGRMDDIVRQAIAKWPNVPHCYGWLGLDARGNWYMRDDRIQAAGPFAADKGSLLKHEKLLDFIHRNYEPTIAGCWFFQNGPQRVYVELEAAPWVWRLAQATASHRTAGARPREACVLDETGPLYLDTDIGFGLVHTLDMEQAADAVETKLWSPQEMARTACRSASVRPQPAGLQRTNEKGRDSGLFFGAPAYLAAFTMYSTAARESASEALVRPWAASRPCR
jgi:hypothetical protein